MSKYLELRGKAPKTTNERKREVRGIKTPEDKAKKADSSAAGIQPAKIEKKETSSPILKHSGIGPANLGGPGMKSHVHACGTPKKSSALNSGHSPLEFNDKLEAAVDSGKITGKFADAIKKGAPTKKLEAGSINMKPKSDVEKYRKLDVKESV